MNFRGQQVLVTGATGLVGARLAECLAQQGAQVRALVRSSAKAEALTQRFAELPITPYLGDLADLPALERAAAGCQIVFHCAAWVSDRGSREDFYRANVLGTENILRACRSVQRFIHTSTVGVYGLQPQDGTNETFPFNTSNNLYCETKIASENLVMQAVTQQGFPAVIVRPGSVYGPYSAAWTLRPIKALLANQLFLIGDGKGLCNYIYIDNLVTGMLQAATQPNILGEAFILTEGRAATWQEFFGYYNQMLGRPPLKSLPLPIAYLVATGMEIAEKFTGKKATLSRSAVGFLTRRATFSIKKAQQMLGFSPQISLVEGMQHTENWLRSAGIIPPRLGQSSKT
jgi:nucleoside-diphosphate-sugar epimerase